MTDLSPAFCKGIFPFKIGTTSFIYPDTYAQNVSRLGAFFDEIELLFLQSDPPDVLPEKDEIQTLAQLGRDLDVGYNVHLPYDIDPGHEEDRIRNHAVDILKTVFDFSEPLAPSTHTLHLPLDVQNPEGQRLKKWQKNLEKSLSRLTDLGISGQTLSIETLTYPLDWVEDVILAFDLRVCLDIGHLMARGIEVFPVFEKYAGRIRIIHLHGVDGPNDHLALNTLPKSRQSEIMAILQQFTGTVSIEVFSLDNLLSSLCFFEPLREKESRLSNTS